MGGEAGQVTYVKGYGKVVAGGKVEVGQEGGKAVTLSAKSTVIATGSCVTPLPGLTIDEERCGRPRPPSCNPTAASSS